MSKYYIVSTAYKQRLGTLKDQVMHDPSPMVNITLGRRQYGVATAIKTKSKRAFKSRGYIRKKKYKLIVIPSKYILRNA